MGGWVAAHTRHKQGDKMTAENDRYEDSRGGVPLSINSYDVHAACMEDTQVAGGSFEVNSSVLSFLPEGSPVTLAEARYTVDPDTHSCQWETTL